MKRNNDSSLFELNTAALRAVLGAFILLGLLLSLTHGQSPAAENEATVVFGVT